MNGWWVTVASTSPFSSSSALSSWLMPMKHQGQTMSEKTSISIFFMGDLLRCGRFRSAGVLQGLDVGRVELQLGGFQDFVQLLDGGGAGERGCDPGHQPGERDLSGRGLVAGADLVQGGEHALAPGVHVLLDVVGARAPFKVV